MGAGAALVRDLDPRVLVTAEGTGTGTAATGDGTTAAAAVVVDFLGTV